MSDDAPVSEVSEAFGYLVRPMRCSAGRNIHARMT